MSLGPFYPKLARANLGRRAHRGRPYESLLSPFGITP
jgi:hypothetical protein